MDVAIEQQKRIERNRVFDSLQHDTRLLILRSRTVEQLVNAPDVLIADLAKAAIGGDDSALEQLRTFAAYAHEKLSEDIDDLLSDEGEKQVSEQNKDLEIAGNIVYETENCYPDLSDLISVMSKMASLDTLSLRRAEKEKVKAKRARIKDTAPRIYQDFRAIFDWLRLVIPFCRFHGKHSRVPAKEILKLAESFIGRKLNEEAFLVAIHLNNLRVYEPSFELEDGEARFDYLEIKMPDLGRIEEVRDRPV